MASSPPINHLSHLARKAICGPLESGDFISALESAQSILRWKDCQASPDFLSQVVAIISFCEPAAEKQRTERIRAEEEQRLQYELEIVRRAEAKAKAEMLRAQTIGTFGPLAEKYGIPREAVVEGFEPSYLVVILQKLEEAVGLQENHVKWLLDQKYFLAVANYYYSEYHGSGDAWALAMGGRYFRQGGLPKAIIDYVTDDTIRRILDTRARSAVLTNRGGAKRDLSDLEGATNDALEAINASPRSYHPHNLLGAIFYQTGQPGLGDQHFEQAQALGATPKQQEYEIKSALRMSPPDVRKVVVEHLLAKDHVKYAWVSQYLVRP